LLNSSILKCLFALFAALVVTQALGAPAPSRSEAVAFFSALKEQNTIRLQETDKAIGKKLDETETKGARLLSAIHAEIEQLRSEKKELLLRQDFLDRMILQVDKNYDGQHPRQFLEGALKTMTKAEITSTTSSSIWPFLDNLRRLIARVPDNQDRVLSLVEGYMKQTSIANPMSPDEFMANVAYTNGSQSEGAKPMDRTVVGEYAEKQLKQIAEPPTPVAPKVDAIATPQEPPTKTAN
jgi:molecular chaperone GrpE (heat shock protein)